MEKQMNKLLFLGLICSVSLFGSTEYRGSTTAAVSIAGGIIKTQNLETVVKYKRSECPVCKGKGWYISGDGIKRVDCGYCEPDKTSEPPAITNTPDHKTKVFRR